MVGIPDERETAVVGSAVAALVAAQDALVGAELVIRGLVAELAEKDSAHAFADSRMCPVPGCDVAVIEHHRRIDNLQRQVWRLQQRLVEVSVGSTTGQIRERGDPG